MRDYLTSSVVLAGTVTQRQNSVTRGRRSKALLVLAAAGAAGLLGNEARAANANWTGNTDSNWAPSTNWSAATPTTGNTATFNGAGNGNTTINIDAGRTVTSVRFDSTAGTYTIGAGGANADDTLSLVSGGTISILGTLTPTGRVETFNAPLSLGGNYTFTNAQVGAGSSLVFAGNITNSAVSTLNLTGAGTGTNQITGNISDGTGVQTVSFTATVGKWELSGTNNTYSGGTTLNTATGTMQLGSNTALGTGNITFTAGKIQAGASAVSLINTSTFTAQTFQGNQNIGLSGKLTVAAGADRTLTSSITGGGVLSLGAIDLAPSGDGTAHKLTIAGTGNTTINDRIANGGTVANSLTIASSGTTKLSVGSSYTGGTTVNTTGGTGIVQVGSDTAFGTGDITYTKGVIEAVGGARTLANNINDFSGGAVQGSQNLTFSGLFRIGASNTRTLNVTNAGATTFDNMGLSYASANGAVAITGAGAVNIGFLSNGGGTGTGNSGGGGSNLIYAGSNTLTLSGANIHTGITTFGSGTVVVNSLANGGTTFTIPATTNGVATLTVSSVTGLAVGQTIITTGQGGGNSSIPFGTTIGSVGATTIGLSSTNTWTTATAGTTTAFAGTPNALGISTNAATNLIFNGGTMKYTGGATSTDRLFTLGGGGGTIDSSGSGLLSFTNTGTISTTTTTHATTLTGTNAVTFINLVNTADLCAGMTVTGTAGIAPGTTIASIDSISSLTLNQATTAGASTLSFTGGPARTLTLTGNNAGSLAGMLADPVGTTARLSKTGGGTWIVKAANTYSGGTTVSNGALLVNNTAGSGTGTGAVSVSGSGTKLGGSGTIAPGSSNGLTVGSGSLFSPGGDASGDTLATLKLDGLNTDGTLLTMSGGAKFAMGLSATGGTTSSPGQSDALMVLNAHANDIVFNNTVIDLSTAALTSGGYYKLFDTDLASGTWSGLGLTGQVITSGLTVGTAPTNATSTELILGNGTTLGDAGDIYLSVVVPEPTTLAGLMLAGGACFLGRRRKRMSVSNETMGIE